MLRTHGLGLDFSAMLRKARQDLQALIDSARTSGHYRVPAESRCRLNQSAGSAGGRAGHLHDHPSRNAAWVLPHGISRVDTAHAVPLAGETHAAMARLGPAG